MIGETTRIPHCFVTHSLTYVTWADTALTGGQVTSASQPFRSLDLEDEYAAVQVLSHIVPASTKQKSIA
jgi:hypothetical protein